VPLVDAGAIVRGPSRILCRLCGTQIVKTRPSPRFVVYVIGLSVPAHTPGDAAVMDDPAVRKGPAI
jgi:hypothetical protein